MATDRHWLSIAEAARLIERRELSPLDLVDACLERVEALDGRLNAFITVLADEARVAARQAADEIANGGYSGPLHGIPVALKDIFYVAGAPMTAASRIFGDAISEEDSEVTRRLRAAGAIVLGTLNLHEIALGATGINLYTGPARNPWNTDYITGGSSSGAGAAVAAGLCFAGMGTDTGGSIRIPAALCGLAGIKPTFGRVSRRGLLPLSWSLDHAGPLTRSVEDAAIVLQAIAGHDPGDPASDRSSVPDYGATLGDGVRGLRIGVPDRYFGDGADAEVEAAFREALRRLEGLGAELSEFSPPHADEMPGAIAAIMLPEAFTFHRSAMEERPGEIGEDVRYRLELGAAYPAAEYIQALRFREMLVEAWREDVFGGIDLVATATTMVAARPIDGSDLSTTFSLIRNTNPFNLLGTPAISVPCGFTGAGLPIGLQLAGRWFDEATVLRAAHAYENATDWHSRRPPL
ncbi:MAG: amidase [Chloroflexi bacterium]|nr:amidase [Chloroflexota bacterium]MCI0819335.1 amidase [Chloroflexota bacterium]